MKNITLAIDAMGGDHGPQVVVPACVQAVKKNPELILLLVGDETKIKDCLTIHNNVINKRLIIVHASEVVGMDELPSSALRNKKNSSMRVAINLVKEGKAEGCVSAGNTGALWAIARFVLKMLPGIDRPAIIATLPTLKGKTRVIDLGANVDSCAEHLFQFAVMGSALIKAVDKIDRPEIAVLNIGVEEIKGNDQVKRTAQILSDCTLLNYAGYVEGDAFYLGGADLIVCDGFTGNVALKASEGLAKLMMTVLRQSFSKSLLGRFLGLLTLPALNHLKKRIDPSRYNGASLLGLNGIVIKSHGSAKEFAFESAIGEAIVQVKSNVVNLLRMQITDFINQGLLL